MVAIRCSWGCACDGLMESMPATLGHPRRDRMAKLPSLRDSLQVKPGSKVDLAKFDTSATFGRSKDDSADVLAGDIARLSDLQDRLWAEAKHRVLVVLQGIDAAGKDGTVRHVMGAFNPM